MLRQWKLQVDCLSDDLAADVWGATGTAHAARLLAAAVRRARQQGQDGPAGGKKVGGGGGTRYEVAAGRCSGTTGRVHCWIVLIGDGDEPRRGQGRSGSG